GGGLGYAGKQAGTTFVLVFVALSPATDIYEPLYRLWGVVLGVIVVAAIFLILAPEFASEAMVPRLEKMILAILHLFEAEKEHLGERQIADIETEAARPLAHLLEVADDARLEGLSTPLDSDAIIDTIGSLRRIPHRVAYAASTRLSPNFA